MQMDTYIIQMDEYVMQMDAYIIQVGLQTCIIVCLPSKQGVEKSSYK